MQVADDRVEDKTFFFLFPTANPGVGSHVIQRPAAGQGDSYHEISPDFFVKTYTKTI